jgi:hypothetical protein
VKMSKESTEQFTLENDLDIILGTILVYLNGDKKRRFICWSTTNHGKTREERLKQAHKDGILDLPEINFNSGVFPTRLRALGLKIELRPHNAVWKLTIRK